MATSSSTYTEAQSTENAAHSDTDDEASTAAEPGAVEDTAYDEPAHQFWDQFFTLEGEATHARGSAATAPALSSSASSLHDAAKHTLSTQCTAPGSPIEWIASHAELSEAGVFTHAASPLLRTDRILIVGCGSSTLGPCLYDDGFTHISSMDVSSVVIDRMRREHGLVRPGMSWWVGSCTNMRGGAVTDASFDVVIDKGTADTLQFRTRSSRSHQALMNMLEEVHRVLTPTGSYYCITPRRRMTQLIQPHLHWGVHRITVHVDGESRRVHKDAIMVDLHAATAASTAAAATSAGVAVASPSTAASEAGASAPAAAASASSASAVASIERLTMETVKNEAYVHLCVKVPPRTLKQEGTAVTPAANLPRTVREAQLLLQRVQQHHLHQAQLDSSSSSAAAAAVAASSSVASPSLPLPLLSPPSLSRLVRSTLSGQVPPLADGSRTQTLVSFEVLITSKRKLSKKLVIYGATVVEEQGQQQMQQQQQQHEAQEIPAAAAVSASAAGASSCSSTASSTPSALASIAAAPAASTLDPFTPNLSRLELMSHFEDYLSSLPSSPDAAASSATAAAVSPSISPAQVSYASVAPVCAAGNEVADAAALAAYTETRSLVRKGDRARVEGFIGLNRAGCPAVFIRSLVLLSVGEQRMKCLAQRATYHGMHIAHEEHAAAASPA